MLLPNAHISGNISPRNVSQDILVLFFFLAEKCNRRTPDLAIWTDQKYLMRKTKFCVVMKLQHTAPFLCFRVILLEAKREILL